MDNIRFFLFNDLDQLFITKRDLKKNYPNLTVLDNKDTLVLSVGINPSVTYEKRICAFIKNMGGVPIPNNLGT